MIALAQSMAFAIAAVVAIGTIAATVIPQRARIAAILLQRAEQQQVSHG